jgi:hypothetical protein
MCTRSTRGYAVVQLVEALHYKPEGVIPVGVIGIFERLNPSGRTMALGTAQPLTEMSTGGISWGQRQLLHRTDNLTTFMWQLSRNSGSLNLLQSYGPVQACIGIASFTHSKDFINNV